MTRHIFAGSEAEEQRSPGRAGPRRLRPPASAPSSCPATSGPLKLRGPAGAPESQLRKLRTRLQRPLRPTHANVASRPPPSRPRRPHPLLSLVAPWVLAALPSSRSLLLPARARRKRSGSSVRPLQSGLRPQTGEAGCGCPRPVCGSLAPLPLSWDHYGAPRVGAAPAGTAVRAAAAPNPS